ncbi:MAG: endonuclease III [Bacilli bacterium]|nr:endonuclease III [Bacilli bacterium]
MSRANEIHLELERLYPIVRCELDYQDHFQLLISVVLSAQTTDASVNRITPALFSKYPNAAALSQAEIAEVHKLIRSIGLSNIKSRNIIALSKRLVEEKEGIVPADFGYLLSLPGVGRKTANVVLGEAFQIPTIPVDTHVLRVSKRLGLSASDNPLEVEKDLARLYPEEEWYYLHLRIIYFGRYFCKAKKPSCEKCRFTDFCLYYQNNN